jgi:hypothetical protein
MVLDDLVFALLVTVLCSWFVASVLCQIPRNLKRWEPSRAEQWVRAHDAFGFIPRWHFFAPVPVTDDLHLLYRDRLSNGHITRWFEVHPRKAPKWVGAVWNPCRRQNKGLIDVTAEIAKASLVLEGDAQQIQLTLSYIAALNFVCSLPRDHVADATQFLIMRSRAVDENPDHEVVFLSAMHTSEPSICNR